jgi:hypothetical protein
MHIMRTYLDAVGDGDTTVKELGDLPHVLLREAAGGDRGGAHANATGGQRALVACQTTTKAQRVPSI